jgi:hypothetical protein
MSNDDDRARAIMLGCCAAVAAIVVVSSLLSKYGVFDKVIWAEGEFDGCTVVYIERVGSYKTGMGGAF